MEVGRRARSVRSVALLLPLLLLGTATADQELPQAAAHKQIVYRYIPIDKAFLNVDKSYDNYYRTNPTSEKARKDYSSYKGRLDSYEQLYNNDYRLRSDYSDYQTGAGSSGGEVDTYSSYSRGDSHHHSPGDSHHHSPSSSKTNAYDYSDSYDYDYSHDFTPTKAPRRRIKKKKKKKKTSTSAKVLDFAEGMIRRMWSPRDSGGGHGHKGGHKKRKKTRKFKWPKLVTFEGVMQFLSYLFSLGAVIGYIILVALNAVASDGWSSVWNRSLDAGGGGAELVNGEALRLLRLLDAAIARYQTEAD